VDPDPSDPNVSCPTSRDIRQRIRADMRTSIFSTNLKITAHSLNRGNMKIERYIRHLQPLVASNIQRNMSALHHLRSPAYRPPPTVLGDTPSFKFAASFTITFDAMPLSSLPPSPFYRFKVEFMEARKEALHSKC
jgi:hypothetical protein